MPLVPSHSVTLVLSHSVTAEKDLCILEACSELSLPGLCMQLPTIIHQYICNLLTGKSAGNSQVQF